MDGHTAQKIRLLEKSNIALTQENTYLSARLLQMSEQVDTAKKAAHTDRLLTAALVRVFGGGMDTVHLPVSAVDEIKAGLSTPPGMSVHTSKVEDGTAWLIELRKNAPTARIVYQCAACNQDHLDPVTREPTEAEAKDGVLWVATCPNKHAEVKMVRELPAPKPKIEIAR